MYGLSRFHECPQSGQPPVRSPFFPLVTLALSELSVSVRKAPPKLFRTFLSLLNSRIDERSRVLESLDLEVLRRGFWAEVARSVKECTMRSFITRGFLMRHDRCPDSTGPYWRGLKANIVTQQWATEDKLESATCLLEYKHIGNRSNPTTADNGRLRRFRFDLRFYKTKAFRTLRWAGSRTRRYAPQRPA